MGNFTIPNRPVGSATRHIADIVADFDTILSSMDAMAGTRDTIATASFVIPGSTAVGNYFIGEDGTLIASGSTVTKAIRVFRVNVADYNWPATPKAPSWWTRASLLTNVAVGASVIIVVGLCSFTILGSSNIGFLFSSLQSGNAGFGAPIATTAESEGVPAAMPSDSLYAPIIQISGATTAATSYVVGEAQYFVKNV